MFNQAAASSNVIGAASTGTLNRSPSKPGAGSASNRSPLDDLASLRRMLMAEEDSRPCVTGVLSVKIKDFHALDLQGTANPLTRSACYCSVSVRNVTKKTHVVCKHAGIITWDQTKHFPLIVPKSRKHPFNLVKLQIVQISPIDPSAIELVGSVSFHMHDIIAVSPIASTFDVWDQHRLVGDMSLEITFNYGSFGYGYSPQLKEDKRAPNELIAYSLFPRINPPQSQMESEDGVMAVKAVPHPSYIPFNEKVYLSYGRELGDLSGFSDRQYVPDLVAKDLGHLKQIQEQYHGMNDRVARIMFLQNYINGTSQRPEVMLDTNEHRPPAPSVQPMFMQPFNVAPTIKEDVVFRALAKRREAAAAARRASTTSHTGTIPGLAPAPTPAPTSTVRFGTADGSSGSGRSPTKSRAIMFDDRSMRQQPGGVSKQKKWMDDLMRAEDLTNAMFGEADEDDESAAEETDGEADQGDQGESRPLV
ncbi:hypothetical protein BCR44DRAFT_116748 [Catenaria anguillulae PL171]|uniref:C2 domain-containing protein n=1 Tax=Catenaria anguillulae PL171 TaxID=765915 RepID=A0A1Y2HNF6_9FUNG|nr:hypothetical protein BCR44DRAFT_116748 [Catenaria anguillulae PL171]